MNKLSQTFAPPGSGKSFLELDKALNVAQKYPVIYVAAEAVEDYKERVVAWCAHHDKEPCTIYFWPEPIMLRDDASVEAFLNEVSAISPAAIFIDPLASCMAGLEESSTGDMTIAVEALNRIRRATGAAMHIVHHTGWNDAHERGSSVLRAACRIVMKLSLDDSGLMSLTCEKANNGKPFDVRYFRLVASGPSAIPVPASKVDTRDAPVSEKQFQIMEALDLRHLRSGATHTQIVEHTNIGKSMVNKALDRLIARGYVAFEGERNKVYSLTPAGNAKLERRLKASIAGVNSVVHLDSEQRVNWTVNNVETSTPSSEIRHADAEFTVFTADQADVHLESEQTGENVFTPDTASECGCSPLFTASSPVVHPSKFTRSPFAPPLGGDGSELHVNEQADVREYTIYEVMESPPYYQFVSWTCTEGERVEGTYATYEASNGVLPLTERLAAIPNGGYLNPIELLAAHRQDPQRAVVDYCLLHKVKAIGDVKAALRDIDNAQIRAESVGL